MKKIVFLSGTRADYGKIKSLMKKVDSSPRFELHIFVTGMHMLSRYGSTWSEIEKDGFQNLYKFINQYQGSDMDTTLSNTIMGFGNYVKELNPDLIVVHGDRLEALAGAIVGAFNNIKVAHIEGGEISGTIDESIRHAITKFSHLHFVSNEAAKTRVIQMGERTNDIFVIGSPDIDIMLSDELPDLEIVKKRYEIAFDNYALLMYHPVTTQNEKMKRHVETLINSVKKSNYNYVVVYPNNDPGSEFILEEYKRLEKDKHFKVFPSIRFEYFLTLLKNSDFIIGNSSAGIRETGVYGIPAIDVGNRQKNRYNNNTSSNIFHAVEEEEDILDKIKQAMLYNGVPTKGYGEGNSDKRFMNVLEEKAIWNLEIQKNFIDVIN
ncbi:UDP-N-acetylglucosamine 2-epimerase [Aciduricibacillus chroicocephali]|uniref:UDP-N-acetylglucosamine 2-epimerase n=1 Tax=Aciduricibacillus chroicocephali TaxID=3054939 RepID=A0ABY9KXA0_9BACI|nr:UDP-N-acetylglucosamine 2-epimerase [Bacillaceae bacterium 44XB]